MQKVLLAVIAASIVTIGLTVNYSTASHEPADKTAGAASSIDEVDDGQVLLQETMRVSSTSDLILATSAECSILTSLNTSGGPNTATESDGSFGQVELWITVDGERVPVSSTEKDTGEVTFCNRAYQRTVTDNEENEGPLGEGNTDGDGIDSEDDFIRTRTANAFNWMAFNAGKEYDVGGDNIVTIQLHGKFTKEAMEDGVFTEGQAAQCARNRDDTDDETDNPTPIAENDLAPYTDTCSDAFVGARSLIVEAVHASTHEQTAPTANTGQ
jgi:hypothetical protein